MKFSELQDLLQEKLGIDYLADIARELGVSPQAVSNWKSRDRVPYKYVLKLRKKLTEPNEEVDDHSKNNTPNSDNVLPQYGYTQYSEEETITLLDIVIILTKHLRIILITPTIFCLIMILRLQFWTQPIYESSAKIMSSSDSDNNQAVGIAAQFGFTLPSSGHEAQWVYSEIIKSRTLARIMLKRKFDTEKFGPQKTLLQILTYGNEEPSVGLDTLIKAGVNSVLSMIDIEQNGSFYDLTISAPEPVFARDFALALIDELDAYQREYNKTKKSETRQFIQDRIVEIERELSAAEEDLKDFRQRNRQMQNSPALLLEEQRFSREVSVLTGVFTTLKQQLETTKIEEVKKLNYVIVLDPPEAPLNYSYPKKKRVVITVAITGIGLGIFIAFILELISNILSKDRDRTKRLKATIKNII